MEIDYDFLGSQLRCPSGEYAKEVAENMFRSNSFMISKAIEHTSLDKGDSVLEIGFGNGKHLHDLFSVIPNLRYYGVDISEAMVQQASEEIPAAEFQLVAGDGTLPFSGGFFQGIFTANTLYFWENVEYSLHEVCRVLEGTFSMAYIDKTFGETLPFTQKGFTFYAVEEVERLYKKVGLKNVCTKSYQEKVTNNMGKEVDRTFHVTVGEK